MLKHFRRFKYSAADVDRVIKHLKLHNKVTANDIITRPLKKPRRYGKKLLHDEPIPWVRAGALKGSWQEASLKPGPKGKLRLYGFEDGDWKHIVPAEEVSEYMRTQLLNPESRMPLSRDSAHHHLMKTTIGISRRSAYAFLEKQSVLQITKNIPNERQKGGQVILKRGHCEMDLIEGQGRDVSKHLGHRDRWYWLSVIDRLTGYGVVELVQDAKGAETKAPKWVAEALKDALKRLEGKLKTKVIEMGVDHGREFYTYVKRLLVSRKIRLKQVPRGSRVEKYNQDFQRTFYRLVRLKRGSFSQIEAQAEEITNNLKSKYTKLSPSEAVERTDEDLAAKFNPGREKKKKYNAKSPKKGDKCRVLLKMRKNIRPILKIGHIARGYKAYHGRHFAKGVHTIQKVITLKDSERKRYYVNGRWVDRDEILLVTGTDAETDRKVAARKK